MREQEAVGRPVLKYVLDRVAQPKTTLALHGLRVLVGAALLTPGNGRWRGAANLFLSGSFALLYPRHRFGTDGSDQVSQLVQGAVGLARLTRNDAGSHALAWYVAIQGTLSYAVAGWSKLLGDKWRSGAALPGVLRTRTYGFEHAYNVVRRYPRITTALQHGVLAWECLFPVIYLFRGKLTRVFLGSALSFHVANAFIMGLGRFMTAFPAMHPFIAFTTVPRSHPVGRARDDRAVTAAAVLLGAATVAAWVVAVRKRMQTVGGWPTSRHLETRAGNRLQFESGGTAEGTAPILIFDAGLAATPEHCSWISEKIVTETDCGLIVYSRAGYGGSRRRCRGPYTLQESVEDLVDLARAAHAPAGRKVVLVGHSLGGEIARRAAKELSSDVLAGVVYLDPSHPAELQRSESQRMGMENMSVALNLAKWSLRLGTGVLMSRPNWLERMPLAYRNKIFAQYSDARLWSAAAREWKAVEKDFLEEPSEIGILGMPGKIIAAAETVRRDGSQWEMYRELAASHPDLNGAGNDRPDEENLHVVADADHDSMLTDSRHAHNVAQVMINFLTAHCGVQSFSDARPVSRPAPRSLDTATADEAMAGGVAVEQPEAALEEVGV